jgi:Uncharacterized small protein
MNTKYDFSALDQKRTVYVRPVDAADLPEGLQAQLGDDAQLYAVHNADGQRLALVRNREMAFVLARQNDLAPVTVH